MCKSIWLQTCTSSPPPHICTRRPLPRRPVPGDPYLAHLYQESPTSQTCTRSPLPYRPVPGVPYLADLYQETPTSQTCIMSPLPYRPVPKVPYLADLYHESPTLQTCTKSPLPRTPVPRVPYLADLYQEYPRHVMCTKSPLPRRPVPGVLYLADLCHKSRPQPRRLAPVVLQKGRGSSDPPIYTSALQEHMKKKCGRATTAQTGCQARREPTQSKTKPNIFKAENALVRANECETRKTRKTLNKKPEYQITHNSRRGEKGKTKGLMEASVRLIADLQERRASCVLSLVQSVSRLLDPPNSTQDMLTPVSVGGFSSTWWASVPLATPTATEGRAARHMTTATPTASTDIGRRRTWTWNTEDIGHGSHSLEDMEDTATPTAQKRRLNANMRGVFLHVLTLSLSLSPLSVSQVYSSTSLADTLGSVGVIVSTVLIRQFGWLIADPICSLFISTLIFLSVLPLLKDSSEVLLLRTPHEHEKELSAALEKIESWKGDLLQRPSLLETLASVMAGTIHLQVLPGVVEQRIIQQVASFPLVSL
ncbi:hypothetical protein WMY93_018094 [Mugilogobius chulae]|uniref:Zinc transporter n=1 Tax=Mugilogobius chulae TaxID=88201 RepID=A0AAW0NHV3_9GOBI